MSQLTLDLLALWTINAGLLASGSSTSRSPTFCIVLRDEQRPLILPVRCLLSRAVQDSYSLGYGSRVSPDTPDLVAQSEASTIVCNVERLS